jgi:hypothetical protein
VEEREKVRPVPGILIPVLAYSFLFVIFILYTAGVVSRITA